MDTLSATAAVSIAIKSGYSFIDCAEFYGNEAEVGIALKECGKPREKIFIASKVWNSTIEKGPDAITKQVKKSLKDLQIDYFDLYLIHWPVPGKFITAYKTLETLKDEGLIKSLGLSNFTIEDYEKLSASGLKYQPVVNQIEINPFLFRTKTISYFQEKGIVLQAYRALCNGKQFNHPKLLQMAKKYQRSIAQVLGIILF